MRIRVVKQIAKSFLDQLYTYKANFTYTSSTDEFVIYNCTYISYSCDKDEFHINVEEAGITINGKNIIAYSLSIPKVEN